MVRMCRISSRICFESDIRLSRKLAPIIAFYIAAPWAIMPTGVVRALVPTLAVPAARDVGSRPHHCGSQTRGTDGEAVYEVHAVLLAGFLFH